jgi:hypothetical protein
MVASFRILRNCSMQKKTRAAPDWFPMRPGLARRRDHPCRALLIQEQVARVEGDHELAEALNGESVDLEEEQGRS